MTNAQYNDLKALIEAQSDDVKDIKTVLKGDEFGNPGLVKDHRDLKKWFYKTRDDVKRIKIIGGVVGVIFTGIIGFLSLFK